MSELSQVVVGVGAGLAVILLAAIAVALFGLARKASDLFAVLDLGLVQFGQSGPGKLAHQGVLQVRTQVDQATDPAVIKIADLLRGVTFVAQFAQAAGVEITPDRVAAWGRALFDLAGDLTDGEPEIPKG